MIIYIFKSAICLLCFWAFYKFFLEREKTLIFNRFYLLFTLIISFVIPVLSFEISLPAGIGIEEQPVDFVFGTGGHLKESQGLNLLNFAGIIYLVITVLILCRLGISIYRIKQKIEKASKISIGEANLVLLENLKLPHSFLDYIFLEKEAFERNEIEEELLLHELAHVKQKHSLDILIVEFLRAIFWFNPILILYKKSIQLNHEFLADIAVLQVGGNTVEYQKLLLAKVTSVSQMPELVSGINFLITKKRFEMMTKTTSKSIALLKVASSAILCAALILAFSNKVAAQSPGVSDELIEEYQSLMDKSVDEDGRVYQVNQKDVKRIKEIYSMMSPEQRAENPIKIPPPPPAPPAPSAPPSPVNGVAAPSPPTPPSPPTAPAPPAPPCKKEKDM